MRTRLSFLVCYIMLFSTGCASQDYSYHLRFWEWYVLNADRALSQKDFPQAEKLLEAALREATKLGSTDFHQIVSLNRLGNLYKYRGKYEGAEPLYKQSLADLDSRGAAIESETIELKQQWCQSLLGLGDIYERQGKHSQAETLYKRALAIEEPIWKESNSRAPNILFGQDIARTLCGLARVSRNTGSFEKAENFCKRALAIAAITVIPDTLTRQIVEEDAMLLKAAHPEANLDESALDLVSGLPQSDLKIESQANNNLWEQYYLTARRSAAFNNWAAAKSNFVMALEQAKSFSAQDPRLSSTLDRLASALSEQQDEARAEAMYRTALALRQGSPNTSEIDLALSLQHLAELYSNQGKRRKSKPYYEQELLVLSKLYGPDALVMTEPAYRLAWIDLDEGNNARAEAIYKKRLEILEHRLGPDNHELCELLRRLAMICNREKRYAEAESLYKRSLSIQEKEGKTVSIDFGLDLEQRSVAFKLAGQYAQSEECLKQAISVWEKLNGPNYPNLAGSFSLLADVLVPQGKIAEAVDYLTRAITIAEKSTAYKDNDLLFANMLCTRGQLYKKLGKFAQSAQDFERGLPGRELHYGIGGVIGDCQQIADDYRALKKYKQAEEVCIQEIRKLEVKFGADNPAPLPILEVYAQVLNECNRSVEASKILDRVTALRSKVSAGMSNP